MSFNEIVAQNWGHALELLFRSSWQDSLKRFRSRRIFRGLSNSTFDLKTSLLRNVGSSISLEKHLIRNFRKYAKIRKSNESDSEWNWLIIGQHHGLPTRLLDWTYSPFVALHFCTADFESYNDDGAIWCVDYSEVHKMLPQLLKEQQSISGSNVFTLSMIERVAINLQEFDSLDSEPFALFFEPPSMDERIVNQYALFSVLSDPSLSFDRWLLRCPNLCQRIIIPHFVKWEIRDMLDQANMTERVFFPGLDGLASWLKRYYNPR